MATKEADKFISTEEFEKYLLSKDKFSIEDFGKLFQLYIDSVGYYHFKRKLKGNGSDENIDIKLRGVYEMYAHMKGIIDRDLKKSKSNEK